MKILGSQLIVECLIEQGVDTVFGYPGGQVIPLYDALYLNKDRIKHILTAHEQGASHAADGYARSTGKVGVCIATSGPGATNLVTGIATAMMDSIPLVAITGNVPVNLLGRDSFQEVDIAGVTMPITKHNFIVKDINELANTIRTAFYIAKEGRPGPVLIDIPKDLMTTMTEWEKENISRPEPVVKRLKESDLDKAVELIKEAKRPVCYVGGGVISANASEELKKFLDTIDAPACLTLMGLGAIASRDPRSLGLVGMHGTKLSSTAIGECDLLITIGARFSDRVTGKTSAFASQATILQLDVDPAEFNKNVHAHYHVTGDLKVVLEKLISKFDKPLDNKEWMSSILDNRKRFPLRVTSESKRPREVLKAVEKVLEDKDAYIVTEVGQHQMWAAQFINHKIPRHFLTSGGLGTMGFGTGAAIGTQLAHPTSRVINIAGDGCFRMNCNELATIARYDLPVVILIMNNHCLGMVRQWQTLFYNKHYSETNLENPIDWVMLANAYGIEGMRIGKDDDPELILQAAFDLKKAVVVECEIPTDDKVFPMVAPGAPLNDMIGYVDREADLV